MLQRIEAAIGRRSFAGIENQGILQRLQLLFAEETVAASLVDNFQSKSGKYAISGFPHKLGLLLHGPPGTLSHDRGLFGDIFS